MKFFIASDLHGSYKYCCEMLDAYRRECADRIIMLGDILYHGPRNDLPEEYNPKKVIEKLIPLRNEILCVKGNCDSEVDQMVLPFPILAEYMLMPVLNRVIYATHGHVYNAGNVPPLKKGDILLHGHTHIPVIERQNGIYICNPGSVSLPKNGSANSYMTLEPDDDCIVLTLKKLSGDVICSKTI